jgi:hypothetical protein
MSDAVLVAVISAAATLLAAWIQNRKAKPEGKSRRDRRG